MTTKFPDELDQFENPRPDSSQATARTHSQQHGDANDAIEAVQRKVGVDLSEDPESLDFRVDALQNVASGLDSAAFQPVEAFATRTQGILADSSVQPPQLKATSDALQEQIDEAIEQVFDGSPVYADVATGLAAVTDGTQFKVQSSDTSVAYSVYQRVSSSSSTHITDVPAAAVMAAKADKTDVINGASSRLGAASDPISGAAASSRTYVINSPARYASVVSRITFWALTAGPVFIKAFSRVGDNFVAKGPGVTAFAEGPGLVDLQWPGVPALELDAGDYIGVYAPVGRLAFTATTFSDGYYQAEGDSLQFPADRFTDTVTLQLSVTVGFARESFNRALGVVYDSDVDIFKCGISGTPATGSSASANTYVFADPVDRDGKLARLKIFSLSQGVVALKVFERNGSNLVQVGANVPILVDIGLNDFGIDRLPDLSLTQGQFIGFYCPAGMLAYASATSPRSTWYGASPQGDVTEVAMTAASLNSLSLQIGFEVGLSKDRELEQLRRIIESSRLLMEQYAIGQSDALVTGSSASKNTYVLARRSVVTGRVSRLNAFATAKGSLYLKVFSRAGNTLTQVGEDAEVELKAGLNSIGFDQLPSVQVEAGNYVGFYVESGVLAYVSGADSTGGWWSGSNANASTLTVGSPTTTIRLQIGLDIGLPYGDLIDAIDGVKDAVAAIPARAEIPSLGEAVEDASFSSSGYVASLSATIARGGETVNTVSQAGIEFSAPTSGAVRYDLAVLDAVTQGFSIIQGTERTEDPTVGIPTTSSAKDRPLFLVRVSSSGLTTAALWKIFQGEVYEAQKWIDARVAQSRRNMKSVMRKIRLGLPIRIAGFGDSITAIQSGAPSMVAPNGATRDRATASLAENNHYLRDGYANDVVDAIPLYTSVELGRSDDGAGPVHTRVGAIWRLISDLESYGYKLGEDLWYDNWGVSSAISQGQGSAWLAALVASDADLVIHAFGMNERGSADSEARMTYAAHALKQSGKDVLFLQCARPRVGSASSWEYTNRVITRVADYTQSGLATIEHFASYPELVGMAISDFCEANKQNHPGLLELDAMGRELSRVLLCP